MDEKTETRDAILKAAMARITHYGYAKTTMAEIARDCDMSAGNIYRFFKAKIDIAEAMARKFNAEINQTNAEIARQDGDPALPRLRNLVRMLMERSFELLAGDTKLMELAEVLANERPTFSNEELAQERMFLVQIIEQGIEGGEIRSLDNPAFTAEMIQSATMKFRYPQLWSRLTYAKLEREFEGVFDLIDAALRAGVKIEDRQAG